MPGAVGKGLARLEVDGGNADGLDAPSDAALLFDAPLDAPVRLVTPFMPSNTCRWNKQKRVVKKNSGSPRCSIPDTSDQRRSWW